MKYDLVIFDLDGTVLDTLDDLSDALNYVLEKYGFAKRTREEVRKFVGNGIKNLISLGVGETAADEQIDQMFVDFSVFYKEHCHDKTKPYDGILPFLSELKRSGVLTSVVSNKADFAVKELVNIYFPGLFDMAVGEREGIKRKPSPDSVNEVLSAFSVRRENAVYIGDSEVDVQTAKNADLALLAVSWGFRFRDALTQAGADIIADTVDELKSYLF